MLDQNVLVINTGDKLALFDTGMSTVKRPDDRAGWWHSLKQAGIDPKDIDAVVTTHAHIDHFGGIIADDGSRNFPNAQIYISQADFDFWTDDKRLGTPAEGSALAGARRTSRRTATASSSIKDGQEFLPGVQAMHHARAHGRPHHLHDHVGRQVAVRHRRSHAPRAPVEKPRMEFAFDTDPKQGRETRIKMHGHARGAAHAALVYHLPWPGIGHVAKQGDGFRYFPEPMQMVL